MIKILIITLFTLFFITGCNAGLGLGGSIPIGNVGNIGTGVTVGSDGQVHGSVGVGTGWRIF